MVWYPRFIPMTQQRNGADCRGLTSRHGPPVKRSMSQECDSFISRRLFFKNLKCFVVGSNRFISTVKIFVPLRPLSTWYGTINNIIHLLHTYIHTSISNHHNESFTNRMGRSTQYHERKGNGVRWRRRDQICKQISGKRRGLSSRSCVVQIQSRCEGTLLEPC